MEPNPLAHAAHLTALRNLTFRADPGSFLGEARAPPTCTIHVAEGPKAAFEESRRILATLLRRPVTQSETIWWLLAFALEDERSFVEVVLQRVRGGAAGGAS